MGVAIVQAIRNARERRVFFSPQLKEHKQRKAEQKAQKKAEAEKRRIAYQIQSREIQRSRTTIVEAALVSMGSRQHGCPDVGRITVW